MGCVPYTVDIMSSEDSFEEGEEEEDEDMQFVVHPLLWRSDKVNSFLSSLDRETEIAEQKKQEYVI